MISQIFDSLQLVEDFLWYFLGFPLIMALGIYLTYKSRFVQIRLLPHVFRTFSDFLTVKEYDKGAVHPLKAFFAAVGGTVGIGNVVAVCTAVQIGGPGALIWLWVAAILGVMLKYAEVYLGIKYRVPDGQGSYNGGPMFFLKRAFKGTWAPKLVAVMLCIYGVEIYQFNVVTTSISTNFGVNEYLLIAILLILVIFAGRGGVRRVGAISAAVIPFFIIVYAGMGLWVLFHHIPEIPGVMVNVFTSAFTGHAALGGFVGSSMLMAITQGVRRACYTGDIGIGYNSVIYSESSEHDFGKQASMVFFGMIMDTFIVCTTSLVLILITGVWSEDLDASMLVQTALGQHFPYMNYFMPFFLFLLGYTTINAYFVVGLKCADYLAPKWGRPLYYLYAVAVLIPFALVDQTEAQIVMTIVAALLVILNSAGIWKLRHEISYKF